VGQLEKERVRDFLRFLLVVTVQVVVPFPIPFSPQICRVTARPHTRILTRLLLVMQG